MCEMKANRRYQQDQRDNVVGDRSLRECLRAHDP